MIGKDVPVRRCCRPSPSCRGRAPRAASTRLQAAEFLYETRLFPELEYTFKHALTHEVAYGSLLQERRRALHARIVEAIERLLRRPPRRAGRAARPPRLPRPSSGTRRPRFGRAGDASGRPRSAYPSGGGTLEQALDGARPTARDRTTGPSRPSTSCSSSCAQRSSALAGSDAPAMPARSRAASAEPSATHRRAWLRVAIWLIEPVFCWRAAEAIESASARSTIARAASVTIRYSQVLALPTRSGKPYRSGD